MHAHLVTTFVCLSLGVSSPAQAADYYLSALGSDTNSGTQASPWRTFTRVNALELRAGDRVLLRAGDTFIGKLSLDAGDKGTALAPILIATFGGGRATIASGSDSGIEVYNSSGISIADVNVTGTGGGASGISFYTDLAGNTRLPFVRIDNVNVSGYGRDGIEVGSWNGHSGFSDVRVTNSAVHGNGRNGLFFYAQLPNSHQQVYVVRVRAYDNPGTAGAASNTGSGIVLGGVDGGGVEDSLAYGNGRLCASVGGPVGIWTYDSNAITIQRNESYANRTASSWDGGGFDLDQNVSNSVVQYNFSHDNDGAGYLLAQSLDNDAHRGNIVRYNVSRNDGRANSYGGIEVWGRVTSADIHHNSVFISRPASGSPAAVRVWNDGAGGFPSAVHVRNNILIAEGVAVTQVTNPVLGGATDLVISNNYRSDSTTNPALNMTGVTEVIMPAAAGVPHGGWGAVADPTALSGARMFHPDAGGATLAVALAAPVHYFDLTFLADGGRPYRLWMRGMAQFDSRSNDSVLIQFSDAIDAAGQPVYATGSTSSTTMNLEDDKGAGLAGWGWQDNGWGTGVFGPTITFAATGVHTMRVQTREDGLSIDRIVLSAEHHLSSAPGPPKNDGGIAPAPTPTPPDLPPGLPPAPPFGVFDTPGNGQVVAGEVAVTGWALDNSSLAGVTIYRSPMPGEPTQPNGLVYIGPATFVPGARPDVAGAYPTYPQNHAAGWGYMLLSNFLPNAGDGAFTLHAIATDDSGLAVPLGQKTIVANNGSSLLPFGTIDTPAPGETVSGLIRNWGWALTPSPGMIPFDGSTIGVYIDNVFVGRPVYGLNRADIAAVFPGYANTNAAVGYFDFDTRTLANGVHTISWVVYDNKGGAQGMGSRYFTVQNQ